MDAEADAELMMELIEYKRDVEGPEFDELFAEIMAEADENGYVHTQIIGRIFETGDLRRVNDLSSLLGSMAEVQRLWRENSAHIIPDIVPFIAMQTGLTTFVLLYQPAVPLDNLEQIRATYEQQCRQAGISLHGAYGLAMEVAARRGDLQSADRYLGQALTEPRAVGSPISLSNFMDYLASRSDDAGAVRLLERLDADEKQYVVQACQAAAVLPLLRLGRLDEAELMHRDSLDRDDLGSGDAAHLVYLALRGRLDEALELLAEITEEDPDEPETPYHRALIAAHAFPLLRHCQVAGRGAERPASFNGKTIDELAVQYQGEAERVARQIDEVNKRDAARPRLYRLWDWCMPRQQVPPQQVPAQQAPAQQAAAPTRPMQGMSPGHAPW